MDYSFSIIHLLAAGIKQLPSGKWVSTDLSKDDNDIGAPGGKLRVIATTALLGVVPGSTIFTGGGKGYDVVHGTPENRPLLSEILKDELISVGVTSERIELESQSNNTYQELIELEHFMQDRKDEKVVILTSRWHIPRTKTMFEKKFPQLASQQKYSFLSAEDVLIDLDAQKWEEVINSAYTSDWMKERIEKELRGITMMEEGTYEFQ